ncbi:MAG: nitrous oxide reductase family maturation protein NosD, partial [Candidatus Hodarchaeota archaeon]
MLVASFTTILPIETVKATSNTLYVGGSGSGNYTSIQSAINDANPGDTVFVYNGTYYENVIINKTINLIGEDINGTIIDGNGSGSVVYISADFVNISAFSIQNSGSSWNNAGIYVTSDYNTINSNTILNNYGNGILLSRYSSNNNIVGNNISNNTRDGIWIDYSVNNNIISSNTISNNQRYGITLYHSYSNNILNNIFELNNIVIRGYKKTYWTSHTIENNTLNGRPIRYYKNINNLVVPIDTSQVILANCTNFNIQGLNLLNKGENITLGFSSYNHIIGNNISNNKYHGISLYSSNSNNITSNNISNNDNGIYFHTSDLNNVIGNNISDNTNYGIYFEFIASNSNNNIIGNTISNNNGGIWCQAQCYNNIIYHNNLINNTQNAYDMNTNFWNSDFGEGNYWSD